MLVTNYKSLDFDFVEGGTQIFGNVNPVCSSFNDMVGF